MNSRSQNTACGAKGIDADIVVARDKETGLRQFCQGRVSGEGEPLPGCAGLQEGKSAGTVLELSALPQRVQQLSAPSPGSGWSLPTSVSFLSHFAAGWWGCKLVKDPGIPRGRTLLQNEVYEQQCLEMLRREAPSAGAGWAQAVSC